MNRQAIVSYRYAIEVSPFLKNLCSYLYDHGFGATDIIVDDLHRDRTFSPHGGRVISLAVCEPALKGRLRWPWLSNRRKFQMFAGQHLQGASLIFAVDFPALDILYRANIDLEKVVFLSLESVDYFKRFNSGYVRKLLGKCALRVIQNAERARDLNSFLGSQHEYFLFPVSKRPIPLVQRQRDTPVRMIYSGYFSEWSGIREFVKAFIRNAPHNQVELVLHGHAMGTGAYLKEIKNLINNVPNISIDTRYMDDSMHDDFLSGFDIGVAIYLNVSGSVNFNNVLTSSGKVASYLWNGLAVVTNVQAPEVSHPPFIHVPELGNCSVPELITKFVSNRKTYRQSALAMAVERYDFDTYMSRLTKLLRGTAQTGQTMQPNGVSPL